MHTERKDHAPSPVPPMLIGVIGGLERNAHRLVSLARAAGHDAAIHSGHLGGASAVQALRTLVVRADVILVLTDVNSHNAVHLTRRLARAHRKPFHLMRRFGMTQFATFLRANGSVAGAKLSRVA